MTLCMVCGNENPAVDTNCIYCGSELDGDDPVERAPAVVYKAVNLEKGRPVVEVALKRLELELRLARAERVRVLCLIHGYGSSGRGGRIRVECRKILDYYVQQNELDSFIPGERFQRRTGPGKALLRRYPNLEKQCQADFNNPGVTITIL